MRRASACSWHWSGSWCSVGAGEHANALWLGVWAFSPFLVSLLVSLAKPVYLDRYLIIAAPAFALLGGAALVAVSQRWRLALVAVVVVATAIGLGEWYSTRRGR